MGVGGEEGKREKRMCSVWTIGDYHWWQGQEMRPETEIWNNTPVGWLRVEQMYERMGDATRGTQNAGSGRRFRERTGTDLATHKPKESIPFVHGKQQKPPNP